MCLEYFNWDLQEFHLEALERMFEGGRVVINWPTDHAKSTMGDFLFPLLSLADDANGSHIICCANIEDAKRRVQALEMEIETNTAFTSDFPWVSKPEDRESRVWSNLQFTIAGRTENRPNPSVRASAVGSNDIKGRRGKLIMDDVEGQDARWSPLKRQQLYEWLKLEATRCYEDKRESTRPLLCMLGTPFDVDSIYNAAVREGWDVIRRSAYIQEKGVNSMGEPWAWCPIYLWPDKADKVEWARRSLSPLQFSISYRMDPTGGDSSRLDLEQIAQSVKNAQFTEDRYHGFVSLDPASGSSSRQADYAGIAVLKLHWTQGEELPDVELQRAVAYRQGLFEQVHECAALSRTYGYPVIYEGNSQQGGTYQNTFQHLHPDIKLIRFTTTKQNKFDVTMGLTSIKTLVVKKKLHIDEDLLDTEGVRAFMEEIRDLQPPFQRHNHISCAIWFAVRYAYERIRYSNVTIRSTFGQPFGAYRSFRSFGRADRETARTITGTEGFTPGQDQEWVRFARQLQGLKG